MTKSSLPDVRTTRRTLARGAAWTAPAIALGTAAPAFALSPQDCPRDCITPVVAVAATTESNINDAANTGTLTIVAPPSPASGFAFLFTCSGLVSAGITTVTGARLTMSGRQGALNTPTTYAASGLAVGAAAGAIGATAVYMIGAFTFDNVSMPAGTYVGAAGIGGGPVRPIQLCIDVIVPLNFAIGGVQDCKMTICYEPTFLDASVGYHDAPLLGEFPVTWATGWIFSTATYG